MFTRLIVTGALAITLLRADGIVIRGVSVFDSTTGAMRAGQSVWIEGERIRAVGPRVPAPRGVKIIDGRGKYLIPGLIDAHVHLVHVLDFAHVTGDEVLPLYLQAGVTSVRSTGDEIAAEKLVARFAEAHPEAAPRVFLASPLIDSDPPFHRDIGRAVTDPATVPEFVADMKAWGVVTLKLYVGTERPVGRRVIEEGHRAGMVVTGHLGKYTAQDAVADGIDCLEHIWSVFNFIVPPNTPRADVDLESQSARDLIALIQKQKTFVDPTLAVFRNMILLADLPEYSQHADNAIVPERLRQNWQKYLDQQRKTVLTPETLAARRREFSKYQQLTGMLYRAGVPLLAGTDTPEPFCPPGMALHQELEMLVESGLTPAAALTAATLNNARALKMDGALGSIETGKLADLLLLDADPLSDIRNTRKIHAVIKGGRVASGKH
jgi:imidazolonepropionase-like amidohydrolase